ncbi:MAG: efflux RND transporter periplasmic adaptor subunit [Desulfobacteraceae bacterium]|nr:efflux RND transporter periplasmic adaptor subunit [Desulfobacteraceae bacterium]
MKRIIQLWIAAILGMAVIGMLGCGSDADNKGQKKSKKARYVQVAEAKKERIVELLETTGDVIAVNTVTMKATIEGPIAFCPWREGDLIEEVGQKLIEIDRPLYRQELLAAKAALAVATAKLEDLKAGARPEEISQAKESVRQLADCTDFAKADLDRTRSLVKSGSLPGEMVEKARVSYVKCQTQLVADGEALAMLEEGPTKTEIAVQQAAVGEAAAKRAIAQAKLDECTLKAPFAGVVTQVFARPGDLATPRAPLIKLMDPTSLVVRAGLPESCAADIDTDTEVTVRLDAYPNQTFKAKIDRVYPRLEWESRTRIIEIKITDPVQLIPRLFARVSVQGRVADDAVVVPDAAIITTPRGDKIVFVVSEGKASMRKVSLGLEQGQRIQIIDGVQAGEMVVVAGNLNLKDGVPVHFDKKNPAIDTQKVTGGDPQ